MLSRVADSLYWLGRYAERVETNAHMTTSQLENMLEHHTPHIDTFWKTLLDICGYQDDFHARYEQPTTEDILYYLVSDQENFNSVAVLIDSIRFNAKNARNCIPNGLWEEWNTFYLAMTQQPLTQPYTVLKTTEFLTQLRRTALTATGTIDSLMTRDEGFQFIKIGKWIERSEKTALILLRMLEQQNTVTTDTTMATTLQLTNALEEYARRFRSRKSEDIIQFLVSDSKCSRSVTYGIRKIKRTVLDIEQDTLQPHSEDLLFALDELEALLQQNAQNMTVAECKEWVATIHTKCMHLGPIFSKTYYLTVPMLVE